MLKIFRDIYQRRLKILSKETLSPKKYKKHALPEVKSTCRHVGTVSFMCVCMYNGGVCGCGSLSKKN